MKTILGFNETKDILKKYGFPLPKGGLVKNEDEAVEAAGRIGFPVILKTQSFDTSKATPLNSPDEVRREYQSISKNPPQNFEAIIQKSTAQGMEVLIGMTRDPELGPILTFGLSGVFAFLGDVSTRVAPVSKDEATEMIKETGAYDIIKGPDEKKSDIGAIADVIEKVSTLSMENGNIKEIDINPLFVYDKGALVVEASIVVG